MTQTWSTDVYQASGKTADSVMTDIENMLATLRSNFSGSSAPANLVAGNLWFNTAGGHEGLRVRNAANSAWLAVLMGDASQKAWFYRNNACEGWNIDASVADRVLAVKGGSYAYNVSGGNVAGTWSQPSHAHSLNGHAHGAGSFSTSATESTSPGAVDNTYGFSIEQINQSKKRVHLPALSIGGTSSGASGNTGNGATTSTYRPAAAVGTIQYPDLS